MSSSCEIAFILRFLDDLDTTPLQRGTILFKLSESLTKYNDTKPKKPISEIGSELYNCVEPDLNSAAVITSTELGILIFLLVVLTTFYVIIVVIIFSVLDKYNNPISVLSLVILTSIFYIIVGILLIYNANNVIANKIIESENRVASCVDKAITELVLFENQEEIAINDALCAY